jgi:hypothetical protein
MNDREFSEMSGDSKFPRIKVKRHFISSKEGLPTTGRENSVSSSALSLLTVLSVLSVVRSKVDLRAPPNVAQRVAERLLVTTQNESALHLSLDSVPFTAM